MSSFTHFQNQLLVAAYDLSERTGKELVTIRDLFDKYPLTHRPNWVMRALFDFRDNGYISDGITHDSEMDQSFWLTASGLREAEYQKEQGIDASKAEGDTGASVASGRILFGEGDPPAGEMEEGDIWLSLAPTADRVVLIDHNAPEVTKISEEITKIREEFRASNEAGESAQERDRINQSLASADELWASTGLKAVQIKVGIIMVLEEATVALEKVGKATGGALLVDLIKTYVKKAAGLDF